MRAALAGAIALMIAGGAVAQPLPPMPPSAAPQGLDGVALNVVDIEKERAFYEQAFGMKPAAVYPASGPLQEYLMNWTGSRDTKPVLVLNKTAGPRKDGQDAFGRLIIATNNAAELARRVVAAGGKARGAIRDNAINFVMDPEGNLIELFQASAGPQLGPPPARSR